MPSSSGKETRSPLNMPQQSPPENDVSVHEDEQLNLCGTGGEQGTGLLHAALFLWGLIM